MRELDKKALEVAKWEIDYSSGSPILTYEKCSVIQDDQAHYIMHLLRREAALPSAPAPVEGVEPVAWHIEWQNKNLNPTKYI